MFDMRMVTFHLLITEYHYNMDKFQRKNQQQNTKTPKQK